jgi:hypothetical protein
MVTPSSLPISLLTINNYHLITYQYQYGGIRTNVFSSRQPKLAPPTPMVVPSLSPRKLPKKKKVQAIHCFVDVLIRLYD